jgi:hypothetical protein
VVWCSAVMGSTCLRLLSVGFGGNSVWVSFPTTLFSLSFPLDTIVLTNLPTLVGREASVSVGKGNRFTETNDERQKPPSPG